MSLLRRLRVWWVGCDRCRSRHEHRSVIRTNRRLSREWEGRYR